jgi:hypothetical protein
VGERIGAALRERLALGYDEPDHAVAPGGRLTRRMLIAATLVVAAMVGLATWLSADRRKGLADPGYDLRQFEQEQRELQRATELFSNSRLHLASLRERDRASSASGYIVWDQLSRQIHVFGFDLQPPAEGRVFRIWLWRKGTPPQAVGILTPRADGTASTLATVPSDLRGAFRIGVVEGPPEAPPAPEGDPWLSSEVE